MVEPMVGETYEINIPKEAKVEPGLPGDKFRVNVTAVNNTDQMCVIATHGILWIQQVTFNWMNEFATLVAKAQPTLLVQDFDDCKETNNG